MSITPVHFHKSKVYDNSNIILLLVPALIFFLTITIYLTAIKTPKTRSIVTATTNSAVLGEENVDNPEINYLK